MADEGDQLPVGLMNDKAGRMLYTNPNPSW